MLSTTDEGIDDIPAMIFTTDKGIDKIPEMLLI